MIKALLLDYDGVIREIDVERTSEVIRTIGMEMDEFFEIVFGNEDIKDLIRGKLSSSDWWGIVQEQNPRLKGVGADFLWKEVFKYPLINKEVLDIVREYEGKLKTGILTNAMRESVPVILEETRGYTFDHILPTAMLGHIKPEPEAYLKALDILDVQAEECLFIDDKLRNVEGARAVGMRAHVFENAGQIRTLLKRFSLV